MAIRCKLKLLIAQKEVAEGRRITYRVIFKETGIAESSLSALANNEVTLYAASTLNRLCTYFGCKIGDLLEYIPDEQRVQG
ncbi:MAG: DNA-binding protein [Chloroflexota bacterium]|nr:MAG: DNA-binding protein [Chloroflexota bacterium]